MFACCLGTTQQKKVINLLFGVCDMKTCTLKVIIVIKLFLEIKCYVIGHLSISLKKLVVIVDNNGIYVLVCQNN